MQRQTLVTEMRDSIEIVHTSEYGNFLRHLFPAFCKLLREGRPQFTEGPEQKIRNMLLEVLNRLPNNETLRPHVHEMLSLCMKLLETDNEENAVICLRIIFDLHKNFRPSLEREVEPFLNFVQRIYTGLPKTVALVFAGDNKPTAAGAPAAAPPLAVQTSVGAVAAGASTLSPAAKAADPAAAAVAAQAAAVAAAAAPARGQNV